MERTPASPNQSVRKGRRAAIAAASAIALLVSAERANAAPLKDVRTPASCPALGGTDTMWHLTIENNRSTELNGTIQVIKGGQLVLDKGAYSVPAMDKKPIDYPIDDVEDRVVVIKANGETDENRIAVDCKPNTTTSTTPETTTTSTTKPNTTSTSTTSSSTSSTTSTSTSTTIPATTSSIAPTTTTTRPITTTTQSPTTSTSRQTTTTRAPQPTTTIAAGPNTGGFPTTIAPETTYGVQPGPVVVGEQNQPRADTAPVPRRLALTE